jgi:GxxExxY protein
MALIYKEESYAIMGAMFEVYREMGAGFFEPMYHECVIKEFGWQKLPAVHEPKIEIAYKGETLEKRCEPDFGCFGNIILELKACKQLEDSHRAQVHNYLRATGFQLGLLVNFGHTPGLEWERIALTQDRDKDGGPPSTLLS